MFVYKKWDVFCDTLKRHGVLSVTAESQGENKREKFLVLKHDVETKVKKAYRLSVIEAKYGHRGVYYVQAYLLKNKKNISLLKKMQDMGHEISYHHDVMDSTAGNIDEAIKTFDINKKMFEDNGFEIKTVCQHGNPVVNRKNYYSNRDFFRNEKVQSLFPGISEIMVDYKKRTGVEYAYISDAGRGWKLIYDPETNDINDSEDKNIALGDIESVAEYIFENDAVFVSTHPHRWHNNVLSAYTSDFLFKFIKNTAKMLMRIKIFKYVMGKFYYLAKKI